jgi:hypothetical protein
MFKWLAGDTVNKATDTLSKVAQILALVIAGWWAYKTFFESVKPGLEFRGYVETSIDWSKSSDTSDCHGSLDVTVSNDGIQSFNISKVLVRGWLYTSGPKLKGPTDTSIPKPTEDSPVYVDFQQIEKNPTFYSELYPENNQSTLLITHYPPGSKSNQHWDFVFKKTTGQGVIFRVDVTTSDNVSPFVPFSYVTDDTCTFPDAVPAMKAAAPAGTKK